MSVEKFAESQEQMHHADLTILSDARAELDRPDWQGLTYLELVLEIQESGHSTVRLERSDSDVRKRGGFISRFDIGVDLLFGSADINITAISTLFDEYVPGDEFWQTNIYEQTYGSMSEVPVSIIYYHPIRVDTAREILDSCVRYRKSQNI